MLFSTLGTQVAIEKVLAGLQSTSGDDSQQNRNPVASSSNKAWSILQTIRGVAAPMGTTPAGLAQVGMFMAHAMHATLDGTLSQLCVLRRHRSSKSPTRGPALRTCTTLYDTTQHDPRVQAGLAV